MANKKKIASNTFYLYLRTLFLILITLYVTRILLKNLGDSGYGVYSLVSSVVILFASIRGILATATQRFLNFTRGNSGIQEVRDVFFVSLRIHAVLCIAFLLLVEAAGVWLLNNKLSVPPDMMFAANVVLQCSIFTVILNVMTIPYDAVIVSNEKFNAYAYFAILDEGLKLIAAFALGFLSGNLIIWYGVFVLLAAIIVITIRTIYCRRLFEECTGKGVFRKEVSKNMAKFMGWNSLGFVTLTIYNEGVNMLLNVFGGVVANAARSIANQVLHGITGFSTKLIAASAPQAVKAYARGEKREFFDLIFFSSRILTLLYLAISAIIFCFTQPILQLWLGEIPQYTVNFIRILLIYGFALSFQSPVDLCFKAYGNLKKYQIYDSVCNILILALAYLFLKLDWGLYSALWAMVLGMSIRVPVVVVLAHIQVGLPLGEYARRVLLPTFSVLGSLVAAIYLINFLNTGFLLLDAVILASLMVAAMSLLGLSNAERSRLRTIISNKISK